MQEGLPEGTGLSLHPGQQCRPVREIHSQILPCGTPTHIHMTTVTDFKIILQTRTEHRLAWIQCIRTCMLEMLEATENKKSSSKKSSKNAEKLGAPPGMRKA